MERRAMGLDYGADGILGVLTPQGNTTVEPELFALLPPGWSMVNARLTSGGGSIEARLVEYADRFEAVADEFANAPLASLAIACTGASYLIGLERERAIVSGLSHRRGVPCFTAALAVVAALRVLGAQRLALVSPYTGALDEACVPYWGAHGFEVVAKTGPAAEMAAFHPIYAMPGAGALAALRRLENSDADAIVMLGTGMPTLGPLAAVHGWSGPPAFSCNLALAWAAVEAGAGRPLDRAGLVRWMGGDHWRARLAVLFPAAVEAA